MALAFVKNSAAKWKACAGQNVQLTVKGQTDGWVIGDLVGGVPTITQVHTSEGGNGLATQHVLSAVSNLVIDVAASSYKIGDEARQMADKMTAKVTQ
jgi:hypothetical protein